MKKISMVFLALLCACGLLQGRNRRTADVQDSFLEPLQKRDSALVGDQFIYGVRLVGVEPGSSISLPDWSQVFPADQRLMLLSPWKTDTLSRRGPAKNPESFDISSSVLLTSFDEGFYELPPISVAISSPGGKTDTLVFESRFLDMRTMPVDTATFTPHDIKEPIRYPVTPSEVIPWVNALQALGLLAAIAVCLVLLRRKNILEQATHKDPAHIVALRKLDHYRGEKMWEEDKQKTFYSGVTDTLREYIASRYGIGAMEMTSAEIFEALSSADIQPELYNKMSELFSRADFVKFAKYVADKDENSSVVPLAVRFVTQTYQQQIEQETNEKEA